MSKKLFACFLAAALLLATHGFAKGPRDANLARSNQGDFVQTLSNISNMSYWVRNDGLIGNDPNTGNTGGFYPRGTAGVVFAEGLVWGGYINDGNTPTLRVGGATYNIGTQSGWIVTPGDGVNPPVAIDPDDSRARIYRVRRDYEALTTDDAGMRRDAAEHLGLDVTAVTDTDVQRFIDQYAADWDAWPVDLGAPYYDANGNGAYDPGTWVDLNNDGVEQVGEVEEPGLAGADQIIFFVANDLDGERTRGLYGSPPIGLELQVTIWAYNQPGATLGQMMFKRFRFINKSGFPVDSMFVSQWVDPDVGTYTDDLAGNDQSRGIGFAYSGFQTDGDYSNFNLPPAAVGFDFFQGPIVDGAPGDTAIFDFKEVPGKRNLPMTSFIFFAAGSPISDPPLSDYDGTLQWYNMLNGFTPTTDLNNPTPYIAGSGANAGQPTKFPLAGDPFRQTGDIDAFGNNFQPGDRRIALNSGPFTLANGDTQEVVVAVVGGIVAQTGGNNRNAVEQMKLNDDFAQFLYNNLFQGIPTPPARPNVAVTEQEDQVILNWGQDLARVAETEADDPILGFNFEGYNIYQLPTAVSTKSQATKVATFDKANFITTIRGRRFVPEFGDILEVPIQQSTDTGVQRYIVVDQDYINGGPLIEGTTYYFAVTAYNFNEDPTVPEPSLESALEAIPVVPQEPKPGIRYANSVGQAVPVARESGASTGGASAMIIDPARVVEANYRVEFNSDEQYTLEPVLDSLGVPIPGQFDTLGTWYTWNLVNSSTGQTVVSNQTNLSGDDSYPIFNGTMVKVEGPKTLGLAGWDYAGDRWVTGVDWGGAEFFGGLDIGANFFGSTLSESELVPVQLRFQDQASVDANGYASEGAVYRRDLGYAYNGTGQLPIEAFDMSDPENPRKLNICFVEDANDGNANNIWDMAWDGANFADNGGREYLFFMKSDYDGGTPYSDTNDGTAADVLYAIWPAQRGSRPYLLAEFTMDIFANIPNTANDVFTFSTTGNAGYSRTVAEDDVENINVFPNPYYAYHDNEANRFERYVTFSLLPEKADIRIFNLAGEQVRFLEHRSSDQYERWDLRNKAGLPVASGLYVAYIDMPDLGKTKSLKLFIVQRAEILEFF